jgi:hypothetical protein
MKFLRPWLIGLLCGFSISLSFNNIFSHHLLVFSPTAVVDSSSSRNPIPEPDGLLVLNHQLQRPSTNVVKRRAGERVLCWLVLLRVTQEIRYRVEGTWGRDCDQIYYVSKEGRLEDNVIAHRYEPQNKDLWNQVHRGWARIAEIALNDYDWFVKLDDDSVFYPDNLRFLVRHKKWSPDSIAYFGHTIFEQSRPVNQIRSQFNLGAGYGVSRKLLESIYPYLPNATNSAIPKDQRCPEWIRWGEDVKFSDCLRVRFPNLVPNNTRDDAERETFLPFNLFYHLIRSMPAWYLRGKPAHLLNRTQSITGCCSSRHILWHKSRPPQFFLSYYFEMTIGVDPMPREDYERDKDRAEV